MKENKCWFLILILIFTSVKCIFSQDTLRVKNHSFEQLNGENHPYPLYFNNVKDWESIGPIWESPPDVFFPRYQPFGVEVEAQHGTNCIGLVTRPNQTYEIIAQSLDTPFLKGQKYQLHIYLLQASVYQSYTKEDLKNLTRFTHPISLLIGAFNDNDQDISILSISPPIDHGKWKKYIFELTPESDFRRLVLAATWPEEAIEKLPGNIIIDSISLIREEGSQ